MLAFLIEEEVVVGSQGEEGRFLIGGTIGSPEVKVGEKVLEITTVNGEEWFYQNGSLKF